MTIKEIEHTADYALDISSVDIQGLFIEAAKGMNSLVGGELESPAKIRDIKLKAADLESLLVAWLEELAFILEIEKEIACEFFKIDTENSTVNARIKTCRIVGVNKLVKAVTFHELAIRQTPGGYETTIVFDV